LDPKISIVGRQNSPDVVAFVIDTRNNFPMVSDKISVTISPNTVWMSRDMILMKYLKCPPCRVGAGVQPQIQQQDNDNFNF
jgi:hypothetical protein